MNVQPPPRAKLKHRARVARGMAFLFAILYVRDPAASIRFYEKAFGLVPRFAAPDESYVDGDLEGVIVGFARTGMAKENIPGGVRETDPKGPPPAFELGIGTTDVAGVVKRAEAAGARVVKAPETKPWGQTVAYLRDPDGHLVEVGTPWRSA